MVSRSIPNPQGTQNYIYDGQEIVLVLNVSGQVMQRNLYGPAVDQVLATETVTPGNSPQAAGPVNWYLTDNQGTVRDVVQFNGTATIEKDHLVYDSFGQITSQSSATDQPTFTSYGLWQDPTTAIDKTATRWYTAVDAVFLSQDPTGLGPDVNPTGIAGTARRTIRIPLDFNLPRPSTISIRGSLFLAHRDLTRFRKTWRTRFGYTGSRASTRTIPTVKHTCRRHFSRHRGRFSDERFIFGRHASAQGPKRRFRTGQRHDSVGAKN